MLEETAGKRRRGRQSARWLDGITGLMAMSLSKLPGHGEAHGAGPAAVHGVRVRD